MRGSPEGADLILTVVDTSVFVEYYLGFAARMLDHGNAPNRGRTSTMRSKIRAHLDSKAKEGSLRITDTVFQETVVQIWETIGRDAARMGFSVRQIRDACLRCTKHFVRLNRGMQRSYDTSMLGAVIALYAKIWADPKSLGLRITWSKRKHGGSGDRWREGPPKGRDLEILSAAAGLARSNTVHLLTLDSDFLLFGRYIEDGLGVVVRSARMLGG